MKCVSQLMWPVLPVLLMCRNGYKLLLAFIWHQQHESIAERCVLEVRQTVQDCTICICSFFSFWWMWTCDLSEMYSRRIREVCVKTIEKDHWIKTCEALRSWISCPSFVILSKGSVQFTLRFHPMAEKHAPNSCRNGYELLLAFVWHQQHESIAERCTPFVHKKTISGYKSGWRMSILEVWETMQNCTICVCSFFLFGGCGHLKCTAEEEYAQFV